jgi:phospholipid/cholesterol/gamma-HCH transport system substrate-binding protein
MSSQLKVGIVVILGIVILFYMSFRVGKFGALTKGGYDIIVHFEDVAGLDIRSPVELAGVEIGVLKRIYLDGYRAKAVLVIRDTVKIPVDSRIAVKSSGILGDKYLSVIPGKATAYLKAGDEVTDVLAAADYDEMFANINAASRNFGQVMDQFKGILGETDKESVRASIRNIKDLSGEFKGMVADNKENVKRFIANAAEVSEKLGPMAEKAEVAITNINALVGDVEQGKGTLGQLVKDETLYNDARDLVASLKTVSKDMEEGRGTLGKLAKDESLYLDAKETMANIRQLTDGVSKGEGTLGKLVKDDTLAAEATKTMKKVQRAAEGLEEQTPFTILGTIIAIFF